MTRTNPEILQKRHIRNAANTVSRQIQIFQFIIGIEMFNGFDAVALQIQMLQLRQFL